MRTLARTTLIAVAMATPAAADFKSSLGRLDPQTRLEQVCDLEVMKRLRQTGRFAPDRAKSYVASEPAMTGHTLVAKGAAFRSGGTWYALSFHCKGSADHMSVLSLSYQVGKPIPASKWSEYGLWK